MVAVLEEPRGLQQRVVEGALRQPAQVEVQQRVLQQQVELPAEVLRRVLVWLAVLASVGSTGVAHLEEPVVVQVAPM
jgi:hypothetical protein